MGTKLWISFAIFQQLQFQSSYFTAILYSDDLLKLENMFAQHNSGPKVFTKRMLYWPIGLFALMLSTTGGPYSLYGRSKVPQFSFFLILAIFLSVILLKICFQSSIIPLPLGYLMAIGALILVELWHYIPQLNFVHRCKIIRLGIHLKIANHRSMMRCPVLTHNTAGSNKI